MMAERTRTSQPFLGQWLLRAGALEKPQKQESRLGVREARLGRAGEFMLGLVLAFLGLSVRAALAAVILAAPLFALVTMVLLCALMIEGTGLVLRAMDLSS
jgi:hypothetical protein